MSDKSLLSRRLGLSEEGVYWSTLPAARTVTRRDLWKLPYRCTKPEAAALNSIIAAIDAGAPALDVQRQIAAAGLDSTEMGGDAASRLFARDFHLVAAQPARNCWCCIRGATIKAGAGPSLNYEGGISVIDHPNYWRRPVVSVGRKAEITTFSPYGPHDDGATLVLASVIAARRGLQAYIIPNYWLHNSKTITFAFAKDASLVGPGFQPAPTDAAEARRMAAAIIAQRRSWLAAGE